METSCASRRTSTIDDEALRNALAWAPRRTKTEVVDEALREFARRQRRTALLALRDTIACEGDIDHLRGRW